MYGEVFPFSIDADGMIGIVPGISQEPCNKVFQGFLAVIFMHLIKKLGKFLFK